jgi:predicted methyltransferase
MPRQPLEPWLPRWSTSANQRWVIDGSPAAAADGGRPGSLDHTTEGVMFPQEVVDKVSLMLRAGDLATRAVLVIGDDDYLSIAAARTGLPAGVHVIDYSQEVVEVVNMASEEEGHNVEEATTILTAEVLDVRSALPERLRGSFDVVAFEPDTTLRVIELWLSRAAAALRPVATSTIYMGISSKEMSPRKLLEIERMLLESGFSITDVLRDFSRYPCDPKQDVEDVRRTTVLEGAEYIACDVHGWYRTTLIRAELVVNEVSTIIPAEQNVEGLSQNDWWCDVETYCPAQTSEKK